MKNFGKVNLREQLLTMFGIAKVNLYQESQVEHFKFAVMKSTEHGVIVKLTRDNFTAKVLISCATGKVKFYYFANFHLFERESVDEIYEVVRKGMYRQMRIELGLQ